MMKRNHTPLYAGAAIAAALALSSTPLLAQLAPAPDAPASEPVPTFPEAAVPPPLPAQPQPTIVIPDLPVVAAPDTAVSTPDTDPVAQPAPADAAPVSIAQPTERVTPTERTTPRAEAAPPAADPMPVTVHEGPSPLAAETSAEPAAPIAAPADPVQALPPLESGDNTQLWAVVLAGLVAIALAVWGFIAIGRRKPVERRAAAVIERPVVTPRRPVSESVVAAPPTVTPLATARRHVTPAPSLAHTGAAVPLPSRMPATFAERDALLKRMIAAKPDRANPFTTPKARLKRARLILQSLGRDFGDHEPWIDLSQYPSNWPEAASRKHAAA